jgi:hypothetical protein
VEKKKSSAKKRRVMRGGNRAMANAAKAVASGANTSEAAAAGAGGKRSEAAGANGALNAPGAANPSENAAPAAPAQQEPTTQELLYRLALLLKTLVGEEKQSALEKAYRKATKVKINEKNIATLLEEGLPPSMSQRATEGMRSIAKSTASVLSEGVTDGIKKVGEMRSNFGHMRKNVGKIAQSMGKTAQSIQGIMSTPIPNGHKKIDSSKIDIAGTPENIYLYKNYVKNVYFIITKKGKSIDELMNTQFEINIKVDDCDSIFPARVEPINRIKCMLYKILNIISTSQDGSNINSQLTPLKKYIIESIQIKDLTRNTTINSNIQQRLQLFKKKCTIPSICYDLNNILMNYELKIDNAGNPIINKIHTIPQVITPFLR